MSADPSLHSEEAIIQGFLAPLAAGAPGAFELKDDCATAAPSAGCEFVLKTDAIAEGVHFLATDRPEDIGWKALAVNVSDLAAKGATPVGYLMSLAFPTAPTREWMSGFASGLAQAQRAFGIHLLGGDTDRRPGPISITPAVFGEVPVGRMVRRATAQASDIVCVTGTLGDSGLGLRLQQDRTLADKWNLSASQAKYLRNRYLRPSPRLALRDSLLRHARASMDISDGLMKDLGRMCRASGIGARIDYTSLPLSDAFKAVRNADPAAAEASLFAGDDYEILTAIPPERMPQYKAEALVAGIEVTDIGMFTVPITIQLRDSNDNEVQTSKSGWDHF